MRRWGRLMLRSDMSTARCLALANTSRCHAPPTGRRSFQPFSQKDEEELVHTLSTKPRHVARKVRQLMSRSSRRISQFRNSVTYLMIVVQSKLQKKELDGETAAMVIESVMDECVELRQSDMAHLLFRAALRFRKYGLPLRPAVVRTLYRSYQDGQGTGTMLALAQELKGDPAMRAIVLAAFAHCGAFKDMEELRQTIEPAAMTNEEAQALIDGNAYGHRTAQLQDLLRTVAAAAKNGASLDANQLGSYAIEAVRLVPAEVEAVMELLCELGLTPSDGAVAIYVRTKLRDATSPNDVAAIETSTRELLNRESLGLAAETAILAKCAELTHRGRLVSEALMGTKVNQLRAVIDAELATGAPMEDVDATIVMSVLKGYGALGRLDDLTAFFTLIESMSNPDNHYYNEALRWHSFHGNVKEVMRLKDSMAQRNIVHTTHTYGSVFKALDCHYPRMIQKYYDDMRDRGVRPDAALYAVLIRSFCDISNAAMVDTLFSEMRSRETQTGVVLIGPNALISLLMFVRHDPAKVEDVVEEATKRGLHTYDRFAAMLIGVYSSLQRNVDVERVVKQLPFKTPHVYRSLLQHYGNHAQRAEFDALVKEMRSSGIELSESILTMMLKVLSLWGDVDGTRAILADPQTIQAVRSSAFYGEAAMALNRIGDVSSIDGVWRDLVASKLTITMPVYNKFLSLYMQHGELESVQMVLQHMMTNVPPNPVTATTVLDMLGKMGRLSEMEALMEEMSQSTTVSPTLVTYHQAMAAYAKVGDVTKMEAMRERLRAAGFRENHVTYNILAEGYGRAKRYEPITELVHERRSRNIPFEEQGYTVLLNHYSRGHMTAEVHDVVQDILNNGVELTSRLLGTIAAAYSYLGDVAMTEHYVDLLLKHPARRPRDVEAIFALYSRLRDTHRLNNLLDAVPRTPTVYNVCVQAFAKCGDYERVAELLLEMDKSGVPLHKSTGMVLGTLLLKAGKTDLAQAVLRARVAPDPAAITEEDAGDMPLLQRQVETT